jgi:hypothetical protein
VSRAAEEEDVPIRICDLESTQPIVSILERFAERGAMADELGSECIRVGYIEIGIPSRPRIALWIRKRIAASLDEERRTVSADNRKKWVLFGRGRFLKRHLESERVSVERDGSMHVLHDEEG